jgi:predicted amidophosphoribosyltransferase
MRVPCISKNCKARFRRGTEICPECLLKQSEKIIKPETKKKVEPKKKK